MNTWPMEKWARIAFVSLFVFLFPLVITGEGMTTSQEVLEGAKKEGKILLYLSAPVEEAKLLLDAFGKKYPFIKTDFYRSVAFRLDEKFKTEARAGKTYADVMYNSLVILEEYKRMGLLAPYRSPSRAGMFEGAADFEGYWTAMRYNIMAIVVNSKVVPKHLWPTDWTDFVNPKPEWKGLLMTTDPTVSGSAYTWLYGMKEKYGLETCKSIIEGIKKAEATVMLAYSDGMTKCITGERPILTNMQFDFYRDSKLKGAPIENIIPKSGIVAWRFPVGLVKNAPNPNAGKLFIDWVLSEEGQTLLAQERRCYPNRPGIKLPSDLVPFDRMNVIRVDELTAEKEKEKMWEMWKKTMGR